MYPPSRFVESAITSAQPEFSPQERRLLLSLAHQSIAAAFDDRQLEIMPPSPHLAEHRGAFTTLHLQGKLRGCIGYVLSTQPLYRTTLRQILTPRSPRMMSWGRLRFSSISPNLRR
jgi:hypothetical protein